MSPVIHERWIAATSGAIDLSDRFPLHCDRGCGWHPATALAELPTPGQRPEVGQNGRCARRVAMAAMRQATVIASIDPLHPVGLVKGWGLRQIRGGSV